MFTTIVCINSIVQILQVLSLPTLAVTCFMYISDLHLKLTHVVPLFPSWSKVVSFIVRRDEEQGVGTEVELNRKRSNNNKEYRKHYYIILYFFSFLVFHPLTRKIIRVGK